MQSMASPDVQYPCNSVLVDHKHVGRRSEGPPPEHRSMCIYFKFAIAVRSNLPVTTKLAPHQLEPNPAGLIAVTSPVSRAVWSLVKALQSPLL